MAHEAAIESYKRMVEDLNLKCQETILDLRAKLKVAEEALVKMSAIACVHCDLRDACNEGEDGIVVPCNDMIAIRDALFVIRECEEANDGK